MPSEPYRIVILGGGFAGLYTARALAAYGYAPARASITLVDRGAAFTFKPLLYELLTGEVEEADVVFPFDALLADTGVRFVRAVVREIELGKGCVHLEPGNGATPPHLDFDALVIALGAEPDFRGLPGLAEHALTATTVEDFHRIERHLGSLATALPDERRQTIAVCGAGPSGVEIACKLADRFNAGPPWRKIVLVEASSVILPGFSEDVKARALALLREKNVDVRLSAPVRSANADGLDVGRRGRGGEAGRVDSPRGEPGHIPAATIIWTAGQRPARPVRDLPVERDPGGRLLVPATLELPACERVFALGDNAHCVTEGLEAPPATAQVAVQQSGTVARNIAARMEGRTLSSFRYFPLAEVLSLGRGYDVFSVLGIKLEGRSANLVRRLAYVARLPGWRNRAAAGARLGARIATDILGALLPPRSPA